MSSSVTSAGVTPALVRTATIVTDAVTDTDEGTGDPGSRGRRQIMAPGQLLREHLDEWAKRGSPSSTWGRRPNAWFIGRPPRTIRAVRRPDRTYGRLDRPGPPRR